VLVQRVGSELKTKLVDPAVAVAQGAIDSFKLSVINDVQDTSITRFNAYTTIVPTLATAFTPNMGPILLIGRASNAMLSASLAAGADEATKSALYRSCGRSLVTSLLVTGAAIATTAMDWPFALSMLGAVPALYADVRDLAASYNAARAAKATIASAP